MAHVLLIAMASLKEKLPSNRSLKIAKPIGNQPMGSFLKSRLSTATNTGGDYMG
jgi:hypothetical protein